jgi:ribonuclease Y
MEIVLVVAAAIVAAIAAAVGTYLYLQRAARSRLRATADEVRRLLEEAEARQREILLEAKDAALKLRDELEQEYQQRRQRSSGSSGDCRPRKSSSTGVWRIWRRRERKIQAQREGDRRPARAAQQARGGAPARAPAGR